MYHIKEHHTQRLQWHKTWEVLTIGTFVAKSASRAFSLSMANNHPPVNHHDCSLHSAGLDKSARAKTECY